MTTVLYLLRDGSEESSERMRYSLRSLDEAFPDEDVGVAVSSVTRPRWLAPSVMFASVCDYEKPTGLGKHWSMLCKVNQAIRQLGLSERFLVSADDHVAPLRPSCAIRDWPYFSRGEKYSDFTKEREEDRCRTWRRSVKWTVERLEAAGCPHTELMFATHRNSWFDPRYLEEAERIFSPSEWFHTPDEGAAYGPDPQTVYALLALKGGSVSEGQYMRVRDVKSGDANSFIRSFWTPPDPKPDAACLWGGSLAPGKDNVRLLQCLFRRPSRWEA